ncbi:MAG: hypothetical protein AB8G05_19115 [Oligoflexales bacterium]
MAFNVRDPIFSHIGEPGVVKGINPVNSKLEVDRKHEKVTKEFRHGYLKGLSPDQRTQFNQFMDEVKSSKDVDAQVKMLQEKIHALSDDTSIGSKIILGYYKSELAHVMHTNHYTPRYYGVPATRVP